jgi:hypothetical protein
MKRARRAQAASWLDVRGEDTSEPEAERKPLEEAMGSEPSHCGHENGVSSGKAKKYERSVSHAQTKQTSPMS